MRLGLDLDNTCLQFQEHWANRYEQWFDVELDRSLLTEWDALVDATHFENNAAFFKWAGVAEIWLDMPWVPGAQGFIQRALDNGHQVVFLTARNDRAAVVQTEYWFAGQVFASSVFRFPATLQTAQIRKSTTPCGLYVDDAPHVIAELHEAGKNVLKFERPWNKDVVCCPSISRWSELEFEGGAISTRTKALK